MSNECIYLNESVCIIAECALNLYFVNWEPENHELQSISIELMPLWLSAKRACLCNIFKNKYY